MTAPNSIEVIDLHKRYRHGDPVLRGVSFVVPPGTVFGYLGRNGAGKSTTVRILSTLTVATSGTARVGGVDVARDPHGVRRRIGVTMQDAALDDYATARQHLMLIARLWGLQAAEAARRVDALLERFGLQHAANRLVGGFSGGMRRRLDIATALVNRPRILFLDEPSTGLDPQSRRALWQEIADLRDEGAAILLTTQYLEEADALADTVAVLDEGRIVAQDTPAALVRSISREVVELRVADPARETQLLELARPGAVTRLDDRGGLRVELPTVTGESDGPDAVALLTRLENAGVPLDGVRVSQPSLEDAFLRLTGSTIDERPGLGEPEPAAA